MGLKEKTAVFALKHLGGKEGKAMWAWLDGKKQAIGITCEALGQLMEHIAPQIEPVFTAWGASAHATAKAVQIVGWIITGLGAGHKFVKAV